MQVSSFFKNTIVIFFNRALVILTNLFVMLYASHSTSVASYGQLQTFWLHTSVFATIIGLGLATFLFSYNADKIVQIWHSLAQSWKLKTGLILVGLSIVFAWMQRVFNADLMQNALDGVALAIFILAYAAGLVMDALAVIFKRFAALLFNSVFYACIYIIAHYGWINAWWDDSGFIWLLCAGISIKCIVYMLALRSEFKVSALDAPLDLNSVIKHWWHIGVYDIFQMVFRFLDKLVLTALITKALLAVYVNTTYEIPVFSLVFVAVQNASLVLFHQKNSVTDRLTVIKQTSFLLGIFCIAATVFLWYNAAAFISIIFSESYVVGLPLFYIASLKIPVYMFNVLGYYQYEEKGQSLVKHTWIDFIVTVILAVPAYLIWNLEGLCVALLIGSYVFVGMNVWGIKKATHQSIVAFLPIKEWMILTGFFVLLNFFLSQLVTVSGDYGMLITFAIRLGINAIIGLVLLLRFKRQFQL